MSEPLFVTPDPPKIASISSSSSSSWSKSVTSSDDSCELLSSTLLNTSSQKLPSSKKMRRSFSPYMFPLKTPEISPIEMQTADTSTVSYQNSKFLTPKAPNDQFVTKRNQHGPGKKIAKVMKPPKTLSRTKSIDKSFLFRVKVSPDTLFASPSEAEGDKAITDSQNGSASEILEKTICVAAILKDLNLYKYMEIFIKEEIDFPVFLTLDKKDLLEIGLTDESDMQKILKTIQTFMNTSANSFREA